MTSFGYLANAAARALGAAVKPRYSWTMVAVIGLARLKQEAIF
jgi:hypothetical protein